MTRRFIYIYLCLAQLSNVAVALQFSDFYENDQLIEVRDPPYFDYNYNYCDYHVRNSPRLFDSFYPYVSHPYEYIYQCATYSLQNALKACWWQHTIPPPYYWKGPKTYGYRERWMRCFETHLFTRYSLEHQRHPKWAGDYFLEYSEYVQKYSYIFYWFDFSYDLIADSLNKKLQEQQQELSRLEAEGRGDLRIQRAREYIDDLRKDIEGIKNYKFQSLEYLNESFEKITQLFLRIYDNCIQTHKHPTAIYERGRIHFDQGSTIEFVNDIFSLISMGHTLTPEMSIELGRAYNDANLYNHAIKVLSETIHKNPQFKEAYFERAIAYFETGNLQLALSDYLQSENHPTLLTNRKHQHVAFSVGIGMGCIKGGIDSAIHFVPSLLSTVYGLGSGLWALAIDPIGVSKEVIDVVCRSMEYLKGHLSPELLATLVPELRECIQQWDQLEEDKKGYYIGYVIGHYGIDALICGGGARAIQLYRELKRANVILTLETASANPANAASLAKVSKEFFVQRQEFKKQCKLHMGHQEKHIPGANNFREGGGELTISTARLEELVGSKIGEGVPSRFSFGEAGYKEVVDFKEVIGIHVMEETGERIPTTIGEIHHAKNGFYHVVPVDPGKLKRLNSRFEIQ